MAHRVWLSKLELGERAAQATLLDYLGAIDALVIRRDAFERMIGELVPLSPWAEPVARLRCLRGIDTLSAVGLCAEIGDFARFESPAKLMHFLGLVPSENSSGQQRRQGAITKTGSRHARRLLVEAAWHYRRPPRKGTTCSAASKTSPHWRSRSRGRPSSACTRSGGASTPNAANEKRSSRSPSPATSPASAGRSPTTTSTLDPTPTPKPSAEEAAAPARHPARARASAVLL